MGDEVKNKWDANIQNLYEDFDRHTTAFNHDSDISSGQEMANEYAQLAIKHLFLINGGALIALPAIIAAFDLPKTEDIWCSGLSYSVGLVFVVMTSLLAYWSVANIIGSLCSDKYYNYAILYLKHMQNNLNKEDIYLKEAEKDRHAIDRDKKRKWSIILEYIAIGSGLLSLLTFIYGTYLITNVVWDHQDRKKMQTEEVIVNQQ